MMRLALCLAVLATRALADVDTVLNEHIQPRYSALAEATATLAATAAADCTPEAVKPAYHTAYDAWIGISHIQFGPVEDQALALAMAFWPDPKDRTAKALARLTADADPAVNDPAAFAQVSAAAQGLTALERVLFEDQPNTAYACALTQAIATSLATHAAQLDDLWPDFAALMSTAGTDGNTRFQDPVEAQRALYTALSTGLEFLEDQRLGRPLGTFDKPRPQRAEARRSNRSLRHVTIQLLALRELANALAENDLPITNSTFDAALEKANALDDPAFAGVADPVKRFRVEALQQAVRDIRTAVASEVGTPLGVSNGFNSLDGD